jgi:hypothetical protein
MKMVKDDQKKDVIQANPGTCGVERGTKYELAVKFASIGDCGPGGKSRTGHRQNVNAAGNDLPAARTHIHAGAGPTAISSDPAV